MIFPVKYGTATSLYTALFNLNTRTADADPTLASGDVKLSKDGGALTNLATLPDALPAAGRQVRIQLSVAETQCKIGFIEFIDQTATAEWDQQHVMFYTYGHPSAFDTSKFDCIRTSTAQTGAAGSITLDASASATNDLYIGCCIQVLSGTGVGQCRTIILYVGSSKIAYVDRVWATNPDNTSVFAILPGKLTADVVNTGLAQAGASTTITLATTAVATNNYYNTSFVTIISGTGLGQSREIYSYVGSTRVATVKTAWAVQPDNTSVYFVCGFGNVDANLELILGTQLTETSAGYLAAAFKKFLDIAAPVFTAASVNQTGDNFAVVKSGGTGDNAAIKTQTDKLVFDASSNVKVIKNATDAVGTDFSAVEKASITSAVPTVAAIWDALTSGMSTVGSIGKKLADWVLGADSKNLISTDAQDLSATLSVDAKRLGGSLSAVTNMKALANETYPGAVDTAAGAPTTTTFGTSTATLVKTDADYWKDRAILFTSGVLEGQAKLINSCSKSTTYELFTTEEFTSAPGNGDTFEVI